MTNSTRTFFDGLAERAYEPLLHACKGSICFELTDGEEREHWLVTVDKGSITVAPEHADSTTIAHCSKELFARICAGEANAMAAMLRNELQAYGDLQLLVLFERLFPGPAVSTHPRAGAASTTEGP